MGKYPEENINRLKAALRVTVAYSTAPTTAILIIAKIAPIKLSILERREVYQKGARHSRNLQGQQQWETYEGHTKIFIKNVEHWCQTSWTDTDYFPTQFMTGDGAFGQYLC